MGALGALLPSLPNQPTATQVAAGRPCADPIETQGYMPGPGAFEPHHTGIDFACEGNLTLTAVLAGTVVIADDGPCPNTYYTSGARTFGCNVDIETELDGRNLFARYGHMAQGSLDVLVGEQVAAGDALGTEGESGYAAVFELRRLFYPKFEGLADRDHVDQGIAGFLDHIQKPNFVAFVEQAKALTGNPVTQVERVGDDGIETQLDEALVAGVDTIVIISFNSSAPPRWRPRQKSKQSGISSTTPIIWSSSVPTMTSGRPQTRRGKIVNSGRS